MADDFSLPFWLRTLTPEQRSQIDPDDPFARAAFRTRQGARPDGGRQEGGASQALSDPSFLFNASPLGPARDALGDVNEGHYGKAFAEAMAAGMPFAGPLVRGGAKAIGGIIGEYPRLAPSLMGAGALLAPAEAGTRLTRDQQRQLEVERQGAANAAEADRIKQQNALEFERLRQSQQFEADKQRRDDEAAHAEQQRAQALTEAQQERDRQGGMPFRERHPDLAAALPAIGMGASATIPYLNRLFSLTKANRYVGGWSDAVSSAEKAMASNNPRAAAQAVGELKAYQKNPVPSTEGMGPLGLGASAAASVEAGLAPSEIDMTLPPGSKGREEAEKVLYNPAEWAARASAGLLGGMSMATAGNKIPVLWPERIPPTARSQGIIDAAKSEATKATRKANADAALKDGVVKAPRKRKKPEADTE